MNGSSLSLRFRNPNRPAAIAAPATPETTPMIAAGAAVEVEDLGGEQAARPEHADEAEQDRRERRPADVEPETVEQAADDVVEHDGDQEQHAPDERRDGEHPVLNRDRDHPTPTLPSSTGTTRSRDDDGMP